MLRACVCLSLAVLLTGCTSERLEERAGEQSDPGHVAGIEAQPPGQPVVEEVPPRIMNDSWEVVISLGLADVSVTSDPHGLSIGSDTELALTVRDVAGVALGAVRVMVFGSDGELVFSGYGRTPLAVQGVVQAGGYAVWLGQHDGAAVQRRVGVEASWSESW